MNLREKNQNNLKSFQIHMFTFLRYVFVLDIFEAFVQLLKLYSTRISRGDIPNRCFHQNQGFLIKPCSHWSFHKSVENLTNKNTFLFKNPGFDENTGFRVKPDVQKYPLRLVFNPCSLFLHDILYFIQFDSKCQPSLPASFTGLYFDKVQ